MSLVDSEQQEQWQAITASGVWPRTLISHDEAGAFRFEMVNAQRRNVVPTIATEPARPAPSAVSQPGTASFKLKHPGEAEHFVIWEYSWRVPILITRQEYEARVNPEAIASTALWLEHLDELYQRGCLHEKAIKIAFEGDNLIGHWASSAQTRTHSCIGSVCEGIRAMHRMLEQAVPVSQLEVVRAELARLEESKVVRQRDSEKIIAAVMESIRLRYEPAA